MSTHLVVSCLEQFEAGGLMAVVVVMILHVESSSVVVDFPFFFSTHRG